jgi:hypothetical protein
MTAGMTALNSPRTPSIISPWVDTLCVGGGSILLLAPLLLFSQGPLFPFPLELQVLSTVLLNLPHFLASYRIIYRSRAMIRRHPWATIWVPAALVFYGTYAVLVSASAPEWLSFMMVTAAVYLAWHYTGQVWGMMAVFARLNNKPFSPGERRLIRGGLSLLIAWHVTWFFHGYAPRESVRGIIEPVFSAFCLTTIVATGLGLAGLALNAWRNQSLPPIQTLAAWAAVHLWYAAIARDPNALFWVQIAHAVQYLIFPLRIEINSFQPSGQADPPRRALQRHLVWYGAGLLGVSALLGYFLPTTGFSWFAQSFGSDYTRAASLALFAFINIHHYFTDGCIWKLRQPEVRQALFAHLEKSSNQSGSRSD